MKRITKVAIFTCLTFVFILSAVFLLLFSLSNLILYPAKPGLDNIPAHWEVTARNPKDYGLEYEAVSFVTSDGITLRGWFIPGKLKKGVILVHGFEANRVKMLKYCSFLNEAGFGVLLFDLRYFGESQGKFCSMGYYEKNDIKAAIRFVISKGINDIGIIAESMGGAAVIYALDGDKDVRCVVLDSTFSDFEKLLLYRGKKDKHLGEWVIKPVEFIIEKRLNCSLEQLSAGLQIGKVRIPVFIIYGKNDIKVPFGQCMELYANANRPKSFWETDCGHAQSFNIYPRDYKYKVLEFLNKYL